MMELTVEQAEEIIETAQNLFGAGWDAEVYEEYSGRAMYGATVTAITCPAEDVAALHVALGYLIGTDELDEELGGSVLLRQDSMGLGTVVY